MSLTISAALIALALAVAGVTGLVVGVAFGLWIGELGRRRDAQRREGVLPVDAAKAVVVRPGHEIPQAPPELEAGKQSFVAQTIAETGCSYAEAEAEWATLLGRSMGEQASSGW